MDSAGLVAPWAKAHRQRVSTEALRAKDGIPQWHEIEALPKEWQPQTVVVGLPLNMDGSESDMCQRARKFGNRIHGRFGVAVDFADERLSSFEAKGS